MNKGIISFLSHACSRPSPQKLTLLLSCRHSTLAFNSLNALWTGDEIRENKIVYIYFTWKPTPSSLGCPDRWLMRPAITRRMQGSVWHSHRSSAAAWLTWRRCLGFVAQHIATVFAAWRGVEIRSVWFTLRRRINLWWILRKVTLLVLLSCCMPT